MNREDIIRMAREVEIEFVGGCNFARVAECVSEDDLQRFAALVAAAEREACAKLLDDQWFRTQAECAEAIRARGQA